MGIMRAGTIEMNATLGYLQEPRFDMFRTFLEVLEVYGTGYQDEVWSFKLENITHKDRSIRDLKVVARLFKLAIVSLEKGQNFEEEFFQKNSSVGPHMVHFLAYCANMFEKLVKI
jgi:hypothetical protein